MPRAAVLGKPIGHSLSPVLHNAGYGAAGLTGWSYTAIECAESELADLVAGLGADWAGLSLTMPLKEVALVVADEVTPLAAAVGAANTLVRRPGGGWRADNTDAPGMVAALRSAGVDRAASVAIIGAGGTARAAIAAAQDLGATRTVVYARRREGFDELMPAADALGTRITYADWRTANECGDADVVIVTVPRGAADLITPDWRPRTALFDVVYDPWPTPMAFRAAAAGCPVVSGLDLLLHQAVLQFQLFTGVVPAPAGDMRKAISAATGTALR